MKRFALLFVLFALVCFAHAGERKMIPRYNSITKTWASYPLVTLHDIQFCPLDSLLKLDTLQNTNNTRWTLQRSSYVHDTAPTGDTVVVTALVVCPTQTLTFTQHGWTMLLHDTAANSNAWGGALVRVGDTSYFAQSITDGFTNVEKGDIIQMTVRVSEFPVANAERVNSTTQLAPVPGVSIDIIGSGTIPAPTMLNVSDFYTDAYPGGKVKYSTGEKYEASLVELHHLTVNTTVNSTRGTFAMTDAAGNYIADYDASHFFTFGNENPLIPGDTSFHLPPIGAVIDTLRGTMLTVAGGENPRGYRICPIYKGDVVYGISLPTVNTHRRYPVTVTSLDSVRVQARVKRTNGGYDIGSAKLYFSTNGGAWTSVTMSMITSDSIYEGLILDIDGNPLPVNTEVRYFVKGSDNQNNYTLLANSSSALGADTSKGFFFYTVLDRPLTIHDIQYTPYSNGRTPYLGGVVSISGIVTADTAHIGLAPLNTGGTNAWYIQDGNAPWSGIWVSKKDSATGAALSAMSVGDSVTITGSVQEQFEVTRIFDSLVVIHASGRPVPAPVTITTGTFGSGVGNGDPTAEQYEGMLIRMVNGSVSDIYPTFTDVTEYSVDDGSGPMIVRRDGVNSYSNVEADTTSGKTKILHAGDKVDTLIGIGYFSFSRYKIDPRKDADFTVGNPYSYSNAWNLISVGRNQLPASTGYNRTVLFPTSSSNAFAYTTQYVAAPVLQHRKGYWLKFPSTQTVRQLGTKRTLDTVAVVAGWNLVGTIGNDVATSTFTVSPGGNHLGSFYGYNGSYQVATTLTPSKGYWVKADLDGYFIESAPSMVPKLGEPAVSLAQFNTITITDNSGNSQTLYFGQDTEGKMLMRDYEMPPAVPELSGFDARFASGRILEAYPKYIKSNMDFQIAITAEKSPVKVSWNIVGADGKHFFISDANNGKTLKVKEIGGSGSVTLTSGASLLNLQVYGGPAIPKEFSLSQNYPNPFNPSTKFEVGLPQASHLEVIVYNLLGQKVATLADEVRDAGFHTIIWNGNVQSGSPAATGIYFVRMNADKFNAVRKIMLMK